MQARLPLTPGGLRVALGHSCAKLVNFLLHLGDARELNLSRMLSVRELMGQFVDYGARRFFRELASSALAPVSNRTHDATQSLGSRRTRWTGWTRWPSYPPRAATSGGLTPATSFHGVKLYRTGRRAKRAERL